MAESCVESEGEIAWAAKQIASGPLGLIRYAPEPWAVQRCCFDNVERKVSLDGGRARYGWMFQKRIAPQGAYMVATHHAVWHAPSDELVDVTPMVDEPSSRPETESDQLIFLVDFDAEPIVSRSGALAPRPMRFFALANNEALRLRVDQLQADENQACERLYDL